ncbi:MAG: hypothetical protein H7Y27_16090 [Gemmatimonadaceae bacterium]|nr:hypothetical protein [Chitinophagaceae bacterium]
MLASTLPIVFKEINFSISKRDMTRNINLSSKEISQVMNSTIKSVELSRYRLRKKLMLAPETNLSY